MADHELQSMAARARQRTLDEHTGMVRARELLGYLEEARSRANMSCTKTPGANAPLQKEVTG